jgi:hypothetical protein
MKRDTPLQQLTRLAEVMIQGSLSETTRTCGRQGCRCQRGERHGPHTYLTFRTPEGRSSSRYVPPAERLRVVKGIAAWQRFWKIATTLAAHNRAGIGGTLARKARTTTRRRRHAG